MHGAGRGWRAFDDRKAPTALYSLPVFCWVLSLLAAGASAQVLDRFSPSPLSTEYGRATETEFSTGLVELEPGSLAHHLPQAMRNFSFPEPVWIVAYKTAVLDREGRPPRQNFLCHTFFADERVMQREDQEVKGIYSDAFTPEVRLPDGFGIPLGPGERIHWMPMFNNRTDDPVRVDMKVVLTVIRVRDLKKPLKPLYANLRSVQVPHLYFVPPGRSEKEVTFRVPFDGAIHFLGTHLHPYGVSVELINLSRNESVWKGTRSGGPESPMSVYSSAAGYRVRAGETYRISAVYDNPTQQKIDAMAGLFMMYSRD